MEIDIKSETRAVAERIQQIRIARNMSQMQLALEAGISQGFVAMLETHQKIPTVTTLLKLSRALNVPPHAFFQDEQVDREQKKREIISLIEREL